MSVSVCMPPLLDLVRMTVLLIFTYNKFPFLYCVLYLTVAVCQLFNKPVID